MFERNEADFNIFNDGDKYQWSIHIGTWSNGMQSIADVLFYLYCGQKHRTERFYKKLMSFNDLFLKFKDSSIKNIEQNGLNYNSVINLNSLYDYDYNEKEISEYVDNERYHIIKILKESDNIKEAYLKLCEYKQQLVEDIHNKCIFFIDDQEV